VINPEGCWGRGGFGWAMFFFLCGGLGDSFFEGDARVGEWGLDPSTISSIIQFIAYLPIK